MANDKLKLQKIQKSLPMPGYFWILQQLLHPVLFSPILSSYNYSPLSRRLGNHRKMARLTLGKLLLVAFQKLRLLSLPVYPQELHGDRPKDFPAKYPNALAKLLVPQLRKLEEYSTVRKNVAAYYRD